MTAACALGACWLLESGSPALAASPLERLQQRSGDARWEQLRSRVQAEQALPAALSPNAPGRSVLESTIAPEAPEDAVPAAPADDNLPAVREIAPASPLEDALDDNGAGVPLERTFPMSRAAAATPLPATTFIQADAPATPQAAAEEPSGASPVKTQPIALRPITDIQPFFDYSPAGGDPCEYLCPSPSGICPDDPNRLCPTPFEAPVTRGAERYFPHLQFQWAASDLFHNPLYFENPALERYGHAHVHDCVEPLYSMARFSAQFVTLPYQIALDSPCRRQYALGWYRPGDFAPKLIYQPPLNARAAVGAAAAYTGLIFLLP